MQPTLVFLPGESCGQRNLAGWGGEESDTTEATSHTHTHTHTHGSQSDPINTWVNDLALHPLMKLTCMLMISIQASGAEGFGSFLQAAMSLFGALNT